MKPFSLLFILLCFLGVSGRASALPINIITISPHSSKIHPGETLVVDVIASKISVDVFGNEPARLFAFSMDVLFDPNLQFLTGNLGDALGNIAGGEAVTDVSLSSGKISINEQSLLDDNALSALQGESFILATGSFYFPVNTSLRRFDMITFSTANVVLGDEFGNQILHYHNPSAEVMVISAPSVDLFLVFGLALLGDKYQKARIGRVKVALKSGIS